MQINHILENAAQKYPDKNAVWYKDKWLTYGEIDVLSNKLANYLKEVNIQRGDRVAVLYENCFDYIISYFAILKVGAVDVSLNTETTVSTLTHALNDSSTKAIITNKRHGRYLVPALKKIPELKEVITDQQDLSEYEDIGHCNQIRLKDIYDNGNPSHPSIKCVDVDIASIIYTAGSTGTPKGVMLSHLNLVSNTRSVVEYLELTDSDRVMVVLPFFYVFGKSLLHTHFYTGGSVVIDNRFIFPQVVLETMQKTNVTGFAGVPSTYLILLSRSKVGQFKFDSLRYVAQAGGSMAPSIQKEVAKVFAPARLFVMYGSTEGAPRFAYLDPSMLDIKSGSIGKAISNVELFIADDNGNRLLPDQVGEIVARGSNIMVGYWNDPIETKKVMKKGLYYTGDLGRMDEDGYIYIVGRSKDIIKVGGFRVNAKEIEDVLLEINEIQEVAVTGVEDPILGEAIKAYIVVRENAELTEGKVKNSLKTMLPSYKQPTYIEFVDSLPKSKFGKVLKSKLKE